MTVVEPGNTRLTTRYPGYTYPNHVACCRAVIIKAGRAEEIGLKKATHTYMIDRRRNRDETHMAALFRKAAK